MSNSIENTLVLCDLDNLLLNAEDQRIFDGIAHSLFPPVR